MDPILSALLQSWDWRIEIVLILALAGTVYTVGWQRLRNRGQARHARRGRHKEHRLATGWRLAAYLGGLILVALALMSPIDVLGSQLFYMHMVQHLLLVMFAPPLLLIANPLPFFLWGLPVGSRGQVGRWLFSPKSSFRRGLRMLTPPGLTWIVFIAIFLGWHDPNAYNAALQYDWVHDLEHLTFFGTALLFWWHVTAVGPRIHGRFSRSARVAYLLVAVPINMLTGVAIAFSTQPIYTYYTSVPRLWGMTVMQDQMLGGIIMWIPGSMMYLIAALILIAGLVQAEEDKQPLPESVWATDEAMIAPGWEK